MTAQGLNVIDHTVHLTHEWINELSERLEFASKRNTLHLLRATLHHIRDHLRLDETAQISAQLPTLIRGFFFEGWMPKNTPIKERKSDDFIAYISEQMADSEEYCGVEDIKCVFKLLNGRISRGEIEAIRTSIPKSIRDLWPEP